MPWRCCHCLASAGLLALLPLCCCHCRMLHSNSCSNTTATALRCCFHRGSTRRMFLPCCCHRGAGGYRLRIPVAVVSDAAWWCCCFPCRCHCFRSLLLAPSPSPSIAITIHCCRCHHLLSSPSPSTIVVTVAVNHCHHLRRLPLSSPFPLTVDHRNIHPRRLIVKLLFLFVVACFLCICFCRSCHWLLIIHCCYCQWPLLLLLAVVLANLCFFFSKKYCSAMNTIPSVKGHTMSTSRILYPTKVNMICIITFVVLMGTAGYVEMICHCSNL